MALTSNPFVSIDFVDIKRCEKDVYALSTAEGKVKLRGERIVRKEVDRAKQIFTEAIQDMVYSIPETDYSRTEDLLGSVRTRDFKKGMAAGEVYIDPNVVGHNGYFYPLSVEFGLTTKPAYYGRHYWREGEARCRVGFRERVAAMSTGLLYEIMK